AVSRRNREVGVAAGGVGVANHVEPVPPPLLAVSGRSEQAVNYFLESRRRLVAEERLNLFGRRRQSGQVESSASDQRALVGVGNRLQVFFFKFCEDEVVNRRFHPGLISDLRR